MASAPSKAILRELGLTKQNAWRSLAAVGISARPRACGEHTRTPAAAAA
jgi:hypothetical protein